MTGEVIDLGGSLETRLIGTMYNMYYSLAVSINRQVRLPEGFAPWEWAAPDPRLEQLSLQLTSQLAKGV